MYAHALDIEAFISVTIKSMTNDVFTQDKLLGRRDLSLGGITPAPQTAICTAIHHCSRIGLRPSASHVHRTSILKVTVYTKSV